MDLAFDAVLFARDGTLIRDVPYNGDPSRAAPVPCAREMLRDLRAHVLRTGVVSNQSGIGRGLLTEPGIDRCGTLAEVPAEEWENVVKVNLFGTAAVVRAALPHLQNGGVVTVASTLGLRVVSDATAYCASKFGVVGFTRALAAETAGRVGVTLVVPGGMRTNFFDDRTEQYRPTDLEKLNPPDRVAAAILFALTQPKDCEVRELVVAHSEEPSWP
jgi:NAD(P)-dependent dehydrogenase (short-subunit alcohol dehydrogenase family)